VLSRPLGSGHIKELEGYQEMRKKIALTSLLIGLVIVLGATDVFAREIVLPTPQSAICREIPLPVRNPRRVKQQTLQPSETAVVQTSNLVQVSESESERTPVEPVATPTPEPVPTPEPTPTPRPTPKRPPRPVPPKNLPPDGPEPASTGSAILDEALEGKRSRAYLPFWHGYPWQKIKAPKAWTAELLEILRQDGQDIVNSNPADISWYCANYSSLNDEERLLFWLRFLSVLIEHESTFNPLKITFTKGVNVYSVGLLQLSLISSKRSIYNCTMVESYDDLFDWRKNLTCGVRMMGYFMRTDQAISWNSKKEEYPWRGLARYWESLRDSRIRNPWGQKCLTEMIEQRRPDWIKETESRWHPAYFDSAYRKAGELRFERLLRLINQFPPCNGLK